jgi:hypothetical protein
MTVRDIQACEICAVYEGVNELPGERKIPSSAEEGWLREPEFAQTGWC